MIGDKPAKNVQSYKLFFNKKNKSAIL